MQRFPSLARGIDRGRQWIARRRKDRKEEWLRQQVFRGELAEALLNHDGWTKLLNPWLERMKTENDDALEDRNRRWPDDVCLDFQRGCLHMIRNIRAFLQQCVTLKTEATEKLAKMQSPGGSEQEE